MECHERTISIAEVTSIVNARLRGSGLDDLTHKHVGSIVRSLGYDTERKRDGYMVMLRRKHVNLQAGPVNL